MRDVRREKRKDSSPPSSTAKTIHVPIHAQGIQFMQGGQARPKSLTCSKTQRSEISLSRSCVECVLCGVGGSRGVPRMYLTSMYPQKCAQYCCTRARSGHIQLSPMLPGPRHALTWPTASTTPSPRAAPDHIRWFGRSQRVTERLLRCTRAELRTVGGQHVVAHSSHKRMAVSQAGTAHRSKLRVSPIAPEASPHAC